MIFRCILIPENIRTIDKNIKHNLWRWKHNLWIKKEELKEESEDDFKNLQIDDIFQDFKKDIKWKTNIYSCLHCDKKFKNQRTLKSHQSNDCRKTYICQKCRAKFNYRASFCRHKKHCLK